MHRYPPAVWGDEDDEDEDVEWDDEGYSDEDPDLAEEQEMERERALAESGELGMEPDDGMSWEDGAVETIRSPGKPAQIIITSMGSEMEEQQQEAIRKQQEQQRALEERNRAAAVAAQSNALRGQTSRERLAGQDSTASGSPNSPNGKVMDPAQVTETRKVSITPPVARSIDEPGPLLPSAIMQQQHEDRKRTREEIEALEEAQRKKANKGPVRPATSPADSKASPGKLRKDRDNTSTDEEGGKKKKSGVFGLFRKKDKSKDKGPSGIGSENGSIASGSSIDNMAGRNSGESGRSSNLQHGGADSPGKQQPIQQTKTAMRTPGSSGGQDPSAALPQISQHASQLRQRDQQQQALYQQYLNRSPASPPEAQPSYGLQSASAVLGSTSFNSSNSGNGLTVGSRPRPGSLILSPNNMDGQGLPDLNVVRIFAGNNLQAEATFKTVLLNSSTTASDLVRQAIQRFQLPAGENQDDYYLTIKQVEGSSAVLRPDERPLGVFETLVEAAMELPKVKRSSVGSISSIASNLSMHPAIKKLPMNDFSDDSAVKFYLNRKGGDPEDSDAGEGDETILAESLAEEVGDSPPRSNQYLTINTSGATVTPERFSSPSFRFSLQLVIHPDDLPDDMVFDPLTEAIVFKDTLRDRPSNIAPSPGLSTTQRKKIFVFPKNATVAEVIEHGLERFGILEGVVDGGDEIEDKMTKRRSSTRVRYCLTVDLGGKGALIERAAYFHFSESYVTEKELTPATKVIEAFPRPPAYRVMDRRNDKRRSVDSTQLLGAPEDISPDDPVFILRRAVAYRPTSRHRLSAPLDEIALQKMHRESVSSSSVMSDSTVSQEEPKRQLSRQEIIAAQRAATRANQRAILSAQVNSARGLDVLLPGNAMIRSSRYEVDDRMRYSYVEPDGVTIDISHIVEAEWRGEGGPNRDPTDASQSDLLHGILSRGKDGLGAKLDRVLSKIKHNKNAARPQMATSSSVGSEDSMDRRRSTSPSVYSTAEGPSSSRAATPNANVINARSPTPTTAAQRATSPLSRLSSYRTASSGESDGRARSSAAAMPAGTRGPRPPHDRQHSLASMMSDASTYRSASPAQTQKHERQRVVLPKDDFGIAQMMAVIELKNMPAKKPELQALDAADELLFGRNIELDSLHPDIRNICSTAYKQLDEMDNVCFVVFLWSCLGINRSSRSWMNFCNMLPTLSNTFHRFYRILLSTL